MATESSQSQELSGRTVVVTGSSRGIGAAIARKAAASGAAVILHGRTESSHLRNLCHELKATVANESTAIAADFSDRQQWMPFVEKCFAWRGRVDAWVHAAGADVLTTEHRSSSLEQRLDMLWQVDVAAAVLLLNEVGRRMSDNASGGELPAIVTIGWDQAVHGMEGEAGILFGTTKAAVMAFTKSLACHLAPRVRVNCIAPGWIRTAWGATATEVWQERAREESLLDRWGEVDDVAGLAAFLIGPHAAFVNGQVIPCNGGFRTSRATVADRESAH